MTYRSLTDRQLAKHRRDCEVTRQAYVKLNPLVPISLDAWRYAWSKAFLLGANFVEAKFKTVGLFDATEKELRMRMSELAQENIDLKLKLAKHDLVSVA